MKAKRIELYQTEEQQTAFLRKKGNIITFKEPIYPWGTAGESRRQIGVDRLERKSTGHVRILGPFYDTPWYSSMEDLLKAVDWPWMREAHQEPERKQTRRKGHGI